MFRSARIKLTSWYLLIIMAVSLSFSMVIYQINNFELNRIERIQRMRSVPRFDHDLIVETKTRLLNQLILINFSIFGFAGLAGYFLAGRTLDPIAKMVDEQSRFISDASHELRTPLTSLKTATEVYLRAKKHSLAEADKLHQENLEEINNLQNLTNNLIQTTKYQNLELEKVFVPPIINEAARKVAPQAEIKNIKIDSRVKKIAVLGNPFALGELFLIFVDNAIKYSPQNSLVTMSSKITDGFAEIAISDQGVGIAKAQIPHIFDRFYRADQSRNLPGYGLGLSIAKQIVDAHNGKIEVESKVGSGTTFKLFLKLAKYA